MALLPNTMSFMSPPNVSPLGNGMDKFFTNLLQDSEKIPSDSEHNGSSRLSSSPTYIPPRSQYHDLRNDLISSNILQAIGKIDDNSLSESPQTSSSTGSLSCSKCDDRLGSNRCLDCNETFCHDCLSVPSLDCCAKDHTIISTGQISPVVLKNNVFNEPSKDLHCETHCEIIRYYCNTCSKLVCQECTLWEHKDHMTVLLQDAASTHLLKAQVLKSLENGKMGTKYIKQSIDVAVAISRTVERDATQVSMKIHKAMRNIIQALEEREKTLLEKVAKMRQFKLNELSNQMQGLRNALAGLAQTNEYLSKALESDSMEMLVVKEKADIQIELYANMYKSLQPKDQGFMFVAPNYELFTEIQKLGDVVCTTNNKVIPVNNNASITSLPVSAPSSLDLRTVKRPGPIIPPSKLGFIPTTPSLGHSPIQNSLALDKNIRKGTGQCILGTPAPVIAKQGRLVPSVSFGTEGHEDGQVSRPWGLCVDRDGNVIVADRRNNRIQIFSHEGLFKLKFGTKGTAPGEFDLPAGITTDQLGRIVVVDKDNHRVQIFTANGTFVLTFGMYGKNCGQFRYPWDVAINSERQIIITDTRNYRIQMFNSEGVFMTMLVFDGINHNRALKGLTTPRGVCFTPMGDVIISDFENHRLLLIDSTLSSVLGSRGYEGLGIGEFSRPSGIICDDEGKIIVADSKNHRVIVFSQNLEYLWTVEVKGSGSEENDRPTDVGLTPQGRLVVIVEGSLDSREVSAPGKCFIQIF